MTKNGKVNHISQLKFDEQNPRRHTPRNIGAVVNGLQEVGFSRSIVIDEDNNILAGNGVTEAATIAGIEKVVEIEGDGNTIIAVRRRGLSDEDKQKLKYYDNRASDFADWDAEQILEDMRDGLDLGNLWNEAELGEMIEDALLAEAIANSLIEPVNQSEDRKLGDKRKQIKPVLYVDELATFEQAITATGNPNRGHAIIEICQDYLDAKG